MLMAAIAKIRHGYREVDMLFVAEMWKWQDYMRIRGLFHKGKLGSLPLRGNFGQLAVGPGAMSSKFQRVNGRKIWLGGLDSNQDSQIQSLTKIMQVVDSSSLF